MSGVRGNQSYIGGGAAFTLVELLVVVALVAILAALLLPVLGKAKGKARTAACLANLNQWGIATHLYAADNHDHLPPEGFPNPSSHAQFLKGWYAALPETLNLPEYWSEPWRTNAGMDPGRSLWICPDNTRRSNGKNLFHYCLNEQHDGTGAADLEFIGLAAIAQPARVVWLFDSKNKPALGSANFVHTNLHNGGAQFLFLDGHAARFENSEYWDFTINRGRTNNPALIWNPRQ